MARRKEENKVFCVKGRCCRWRGGGTGFSAVEPCVFFSPLLTFLYFMNKYILLPLARVLSRSPSSTFYPVCCSPSLLSDFWGQEHKKTNNGRKKKRKGCAPKSYLIAHPEHTTFD